MCIDEVAHTLGGLPDVLAVQSDVFIAVRASFLPDFINLVFGDLVIHLVPRAPSGDFAFIPFPDHVVDFFEQHPFDLPCEVMGASLRPLFEAFFLMQSRS